MKKLVFLSALLVVSLLAVPVAGCAKLLTVSVWEPQQGAAFTDATVQVRGYVSDAKATVWVNDSTVVVSKDGNFSANLELAEGENTITVTAARGKPDKWKDVTERTVRVTYGLTIEVTSPEKKAELTESPVTITGRVIGPAAKVTINNIEAEVANDGTFSASIELVEGENAIEIVATVEGMEPVSRSLTVIYGVPTPEMQARNLAKEFVRNSPTFVFDGIEESLKLVETLYPDIENAWTFVFHFESRHVGYGDRAGQMLDQAITPHEAMITIEQGEVKSAIMDEKWDMLTQELVNG
jgi:nitrogen fixation protein FixH